MIKIKDNILLSYSSKLEDLEYTLDDNIKQIDKYAFYRQEFLKVINISKNLEQIDEDALNFYTLEAINVHEDNKHFKSIDGVLYSKDLKNLIFYPKLKKDRVFVIPNTVTTIKSYAIPTTPYLQRIIINECLETIEPYGINSRYNLNDIEVHSSNKYFRSVDGVLYNYELTELIKYPPIKLKSNYQILNSVKKIYPDAFRGIYHLNILKLPDSMVELLDYTFIDLDKLVALIIPFSIKKISDKAIIECNNVSFFIEKEREELVFNEDVINTRKGRFYWKNEWTLTSRGDPVFGGY